MSGNDWLSATIGGLFDLGNTALGFAGNRQNYKYQLRLQEHAQRHQIKMMQNAHQWEVQDLRNAGLNPILSAGGSPGSYSSAQGHYSGQPITGLSENTARRIERALFDRGKKENELLDAQINSAKASADKDLLLASKYASETMSEDAERAFKYSPEMKELQKRKIFNDGTKNLWQAYGDVDDRIGVLTGFRPWSAQSNSFHGKVKVKENSKKSSLSRLK